MTAHHFFARIDDHDQVVTLIGPDAHHASRVLRIEPGEIITVSNGIGTVARARVVSSEQHEVRAQIEERAEHEIPEPQQRIGVYPAVPKGTKLDTVIEDLTELGVDDITPWYAARSIPRPDETKADAQHERWSKIARAASMQSKRVALPEIAVLSGVPTAGPGVVVFHEAAPTRWSEVAGDFRVAVTGPEGGLTDAELATLREAGASIVSLGPTILRAQTAAVVAATLLLERAGRLG